MVFWKWLIRPTVLAFGAIVLSSLAFVLCTLTLNAGSEDKTSDWISAFGTAFGAALTGGALLIAAFTFRRQVEDQHRAQAAGVSVRVMAPVNEPYKRDILVRNDSLLPISEVRLVAVGKSETPKNNAPRVLAPRGDIPWELATTYASSGAYVEFLDAAGTRWRRDSDGSLQEIA